MTAISPEERDIAALLPVEGLACGDLHISARQWTDSPQGRLFCVSVERAQCYIWLAENDWQRWCESAIGTSSSQDVDALLLAGVAQWGLSPLLAASGAQMMFLQAEPVQCSLLAQHIALVFHWQTEGCDFHALLLDWPAAWFRAFATQIKPLARAGQPLPPVAFPCYAGWCEVSANELEQLSVGAGVRMHPFGDPRTGAFILRLSASAAARIRIEPEGKVKIDELVQDMEDLLMEERDEATSALSSPLNLDELPQRLLVEVGHIEVTLGALKTLGEGDFLPAGACLMPEVALRLNGRVVGKGELIGCGEHFLVRVSQWYLRGAQPPQVQEIRPKPDGAAAGAAL